MKKMNESNQLKSTGLPERGLPPAKTPAGNAATQVTLNEPKTDTQRNWFWAWTYAPLMP